MRLSRIVVVGYLMGYRGARTRRALPAESEEAICADRGLLCESRGRRSLSCSPPRAISRRRRQRRRQCRCRTYDVRNQDHPRAPRWDVFPSQPCVHAPVLVVLEYTAGSRIQHKGGGRGRSVLRDTRYISVSYTPGRAFLLTARVRAAAKRKNTRAHACVGTCTNELHATVCIHARTPACVRSE